MIYIAPSLLAADFSILRQEVERVEKAGANFLHLDVMDGDFVPNITFGAPVIASLRRHSKLLFDVHLMIRNPQRYLDDFIRAGADILTVHYESCDDPAAVLKAIHAKEVNAGLAISPKTPVESIFPLLPLANMVLVMTVEPGFGGQKFMPDMLEKVRVLRRVIREKDLNIRIEADGGISQDNAALLSEAGVDVFVAGSAIFKSPKPKQVMLHMRQQAAAHPYRV